MIFVVNTMEVAPEMYGKINKCIPLQMINSDKEQVKYSTITPKIL